MQRNCHVRHKTISSSPLSALPFPLLQFDYSVVFRNSERSQTFAAALITLVVSTDGNVEAANPASIRRELRVHMWDTLFDRPFSVASQYSSRVLF